MQNLLVSRLLFLNTHYNRDTIHISHHPKIIKIELEEETIFDMLLEKAQEIAKACALNKSDPEEHGTARH